MALPGQSVHTLTLSWLNCPEGHAVHWAAPAELTVPAAQDRHTNSDEALSAEELVPAGHSWQSEDTPVPGLLSYLPAAHGRYEAWPPSE